MTATKPLSRSLRVYQKIAIAFVVLSFVLLLFVLYLSISSATIRITPVPKVVNSSLSVEVVSNPLQEGHIGGHIVSAEVAQAKTFYLPQDGAIPVESKAGGMVTLINETANNQTLVATTRLLSEEGILFRLEEQVTVPADGQIEAMVYADKEGLEGEVGPTQFTIPGLAMSLQEVIYAVSIDSMEGGVTYTRLLTQNDLNDAVASLEKDMHEGLETELEKEVDTDAYDGVAYMVQEVERMADEQPGAEVGSFTVSLTLKVTAVYYDYRALTDYAEAYLQSRVSDNYNLANISEDGVQVDVRSANEQQSEADLDVYIDGIAVLSPTSSVLEKDRLLGRSASEVTTMLEASELIEDVSVAFTPFWLKRIPTLKDHIRIVIEEIK